MKITKKIFLNSFLIGSIFISVGSWFFYQKRVSDEKTDRIGTSSMKGFFQDFFSNEDDRESSGSSKKEATHSEKTYFVSPTGADENDGMTQDRPMMTIQKAIDLAQPGEQIFLLDGIYFQEFFTSRNGEETKPIFISGTKKAIVKGSGKKSRIIEVNHDYHVLKGFVVDGLGGDPDKMENYRDKLIYIQGKESKNGVIGTRILEMEIRNAGGECVRLRYFAQKNEIAGNYIHHCGTYDFVFDNGGKNGEGIYIGTAPEQEDDGKNPTEDSDNSDGNWVHDNIIDTQGNECVDVKENSSHNLIEKNRCTGQKDSESAGLDSRGNDNAFKNNEIYGCVGAGIRLGGDEKNDGINNLVAYNYLHNNLGGGIKIQRKPQTEICENRIEKNKKNDLVGEYGEDFKNEKRCD